MMSKEEIRNLKAQMDGRRMALLYLKPKDEPAVPYQEAIMKYGDELARRMELLCVWYLGRYLSLEEWKDLIDVTPGVIKKRLLNGWPFDLAVNTPGRKIVPPGSIVPTSGGGRPAAVITLEGTGRSLTLAEWARA